jgi:hypothetical protein
VVGFFSLPELNSVLYEACNAGNTKGIGPVHLAYNPSFSACFLNQNIIFLS